MTKKPPAPSRYDGPIEPGMKFSLGRFELLTIIRRVEANSVIHRQRRRIGGWTVRSDGEEWFRLHVTPWRDDVEQA